MNKNLVRVLDEVRKGRPVIVVDSGNRGGEGDIVIAAEFVTEESLAFSIIEGRGLVGLPTDSTILDRLQIPMMVNNRPDPRRAALTVSVDAREGIGSGASIADRLQTIRVILSSTSKPTDLVRPGHIFPLRPDKNGLQGRQGHTEAAITLMKLAEVKPVSLLTSVMKENGEMAKLPDLKAFAKKHSLLMLAIDEILQEIQGMDASVMQNSYYTSAENPPTSSPVGNLVVHHSDLMSAALARRSGQGK